MAVDAAKSGWVGDFSWRDGGFYIRKTGIHLKPTRAVIAEIASWILYLSLLAFGSIWARIIHRKRLKIWFAPDRPRPWYMCRGIALWGGIDVARGPHGADAAFYFDDVTQGAPPVSDLALKLNHACIDISKSHVARVFEEVAGYPLSVDPLATAGEIVEKSDKNGVHDGCIVMAPCAPMAGKVYQRIVDTKDGEGCCRDLRTPCIGGEPVVVWVKTKTPEGRFSINNRHARLAEPVEVYAPEEVDLIRRFNARMGLDCGGLDILRDRADGRIYIVDVNKTDVGPVIALSWRDKIRSMTRLGAALRRLIDPETA
ncbi:MAG: hypothetical protein JF615_01050 [Asticcacaulis sp.]|nr:hypothetical protein [Asticcacaulis sp.]